MLLFAAQNKIRVCAQVEYSPEKETLSMQSVGDSDDRGIEVEFSEVDEGAVVRVVSDNTNIVGFEYYSREKDIDVSEVDTLEITGDDESWDDDFMIVPRRTGTCNVMVYVKRLWVTSEVT